ncbi:hypothetical protein Phi4:1_gp170 [Cellulophaga phage phi4:1]|uniref:Uncharacterized protein n=5 Tax=Lightbulbvirus TaxID=1918522 RepID=A0A0S2MWS5_9CAUD|nr:hypothetical protein Phi4:1_gp170 [Cellulophaga phage phi4:1]YP_008241669.1 hypothetical protein Phi17:2_gp174 [Cellulophaga phage phi17:2]ALO80179.1 hypothetical protein Phi4113_170 [Cellulophaga phage phi4:1_13]ALO80376.1 hypothetical protein Phi4118_170 [Cellulophaga phage phi4:1_18]ALO80577.1 hypothetical protein Phi17218_174 [Cellulophaga phage phi17:2_18]AGO47707.1 hypothetical protein Phi17:2_gp174 [Cellulophaga phage phi17:2]AGO49583.1 hypothetical protein Phi4:1_gp170 [Cellulophag
MGTLKEKKLFYRVVNDDSKEGLWYNYSGEFHGNIHDKYSFCLNNELKMPFDENVVGWLSTADTLESLFQWFPKKDIVELQNHGFKLYLFESEEYKMYKNHWIIKQDSAKIIGGIKIYNHD